MIAALLRVPSRLFRPRRTLGQLGWRALATVAAIATGVPSGARGQGATTPHDTLAIGILRELIAINTAPSGRQMTRATSAMAARARGAGFAAQDVQLAGPDSLHQNLVVTLRGSDPAARPVLLMAHIDVVEALREDWSMDPYTLYERDGYLYGRGTTDNKGGAAILVANMIRWKSEGFVPSRDLVLVLTTDEETSAERGIRWLIEHVPALTRAEYALNTDAGGLLESPGGRPRFFLQSSEKMYQSFSLEVTNPGGHSSLPRADNAIYTLARGLARLERFRFPVTYNAVTRESFARLAAVEVPARAADLRAAARGATTGAAIDRLSRDPQVNGTLRTTCVATMLGGGHAENALPQRATATVNCRIFPGVTSRQVQAVLERALGDSLIRVAPMGEAVPSPASPLRSDVVRATEVTASAIWPRAILVPIQENGATDGLFLRNRGIPVFGLAGPLFDAADDRAHGRDERVSRRHFGEAREFWYRLVMALTSGTIRS